MENKKRTPEEIANLKRSWLNDSCWDIYDTEGFEAHREELKAFQEKQEYIWQEQVKAREQAEQERSKPEMLRLGLKYPEQYPLYKIIKASQEQLVQYAYTIQALEYHVKNLTGLNEL